MYEAAIDLSVSEEKHNWEVLEPSLEQAVLHILSPLSHSIVLGQLYLETVVVSPTTHAHTHDTQSDRDRERKREKERERERDSQEHIMSFQA